MPIGTELREARQRAGLSAAQIAEHTKVQLHKIEALENGDFGRLPAGIYLDGIVRAYAHEVSIDPEPVIQRVRQERAVVLNDTEPAPEDLSVFRSESEVAAAVPAPRPPVEEPAAVNPARRPPPPLPEDDLDLLDPVVVPDAPALTYAATASAIPPPRREVNSNRGVLALVSLLAAAGWGAYFYQATRPADRAASREAVLSSSQDAEPRTAANEQRAETEVPVAPADVVPRDRPIADGGSTASGTAGTFGTNGRATVPRSARTDAGMRTAQERSRPQPAAPADVPAGPVLPPHVPEISSPPEVSPGGTTDATAPTHNVAGSWALRTQVQSSSLSRFQGLSLGYEVQLEQSGDRISGTGRKVTENGGGLDSPAQTPISVTGRIDGDRLTLTFTERGARRPTQGKLVLQLDDTGNLRGRFSSTAARSSGTAEAHRLAQQ